MSKQQWQVKSHSYPIADTGDYDGYWEIVNEKGDAFRTTEDYEEIEGDLQCIANMLNDFKGLRMETACEINLHCETQLQKMEIDHLKSGIEILKELCQLKNHKDTVGKDTFYEKRQPELWKMANDFLIELVKYSGAVISKEQQ